MEFVRDIKEQIIDEPMCCDKEMYYYSFELADGFMYICLECGGFFRVEEGQLDPEDVDNYRDIKEGELEE